MAVTEQKRRPARAGRRCAGGWLSLATLVARHHPRAFRAHALAGDVDTAVSVGHQAVEAVSSVHSPRAYDRLRVLNTALEPLHTSPGVTELRDRLSTTAA